MKETLSLFKRLTKIHIHSWKVIKTTKIFPYGRIYTLQCKCGATKEKTKSEVGFSEYV